MKKLIGFGIAAMMVMGLAGGAMAAIDSDFLVSMRGYNQAGANSLQEARFGTATGAGIYDYMRAGQDSALASDTDGTKVWVYTVLKTSASNAAPKNVAIDKTAPLTAVGDTRTWAITLAGGPSFFGSGYKLKLWNESSLGAAYTVDGQIKLELFQVNGATKTSVWSKAGNQNLATSEANAASIWSTSFTEGTKPVYNFELVATAVPNAVPEPGSIVAMLSGLVGLAGYGIRRRK